MIRKGDPRYSEEERKRINRQYMREWRAAKKEFEKNNEVALIRREIARLTKRLEEIEAAKAAAAEEVER